MVTERPRSLNPGKALAMAICPNICLFYELARVLMDNVACEFACAGCAETISANVLNRAKIFYSIEFFKFLLQADNELLVPEMQKNLGVTVFVSEIKRVVNHTDFEKLSHIIEHGLQGFIVKNIQGESTEANDLSHVL